MVRVDNRIRRLIGLGLAGTLPIAVFMFLPYGVFAEINDLPAHPLIVHGVVVLVPVVAVWTLLGMWKESLFRRTYVQLFGLSVVATLGVIAAKSSGSSLSAAVGLPDPHADTANRLVPLMIGLSALVLLVIYVVVHHPMRRVGRAARVLTSLTAIASLPLTYMAGHTGAESVWKEQYSEAQLPISRDDLVLTMDEVRRRDSADTCWTVVEGVVYDMTTFVARHPAGSESIEEMCGKDATSEFIGEHGGQREPGKWLDTLRIGVIEK